MSTITDISTKDTAAMLRSALRAAYPGVRFSVRMDHGTAYGWISVTWEDGPTMSEVSELAGRYQSRRFDRQDDSYRTMPTTLIAFVGENQPREVRFGCDGVATHRGIGPLGWSAIATMLNRAQPSIAQLRADGRGITGGMLEDEVAERLEVLPGPVDVAAAAWRLHCRISFTP